MFRTTVIAILIALGSRGAISQSTAPQPAFEVASIKPAQPQAPGRVSTRMSTDAGRLTYTDVSLSDLIGKAYRVQHNQISGPAWLDTERFDIAAKIPAGVAMDRIPEMLQSLLANRFNVRLHRETRELPEYKLVQGKTARQLQKAESSGGLNIGFGPGRAHASGKVTMEWLAAFLSDRLGRPVLDRTQLDGAYVIALEWVPDSTEVPDAATPGADGPSLFVALQEQLGLKLAAAKGSVEILVIDQAGKVPTEN
jgi:uncharacterized protein (TIGR03435 family)